MKKFIFAVLCAAIAVFASFYFNQQSSAQTTNENVLPSPNIVISQFQTAGGSANDEFIELHNISSSPIDLNGLRLVYRSAAGTNDVAFVSWTTATIVQPGGYYLIASTGYDGTVTPDIIYNPTTCSCSIGAAGGGFAIRSGAVNTGTIIDSVGYGSATNAFIETAVTGAPAANAGQARSGNGCQDTDNNANDFSSLNPSTPRNSANSANVCGGTGTTLFVSGTATPNTVLPGETTLFKVTVTPATTPPSTGITVVANLLSVGGSNSQQFFDDGTNGDQTAGDNIFSYSYTVPTSVTPGVKNLPFTASDAQSRTTGSSISLTISGTTASDNHLALGNPSNAVTDVNQPLNYLMVKPQYALSYNRDKGEPNWVAWRLDATWLGTADRQDDYRPDDALPADWYHVQANDYSGSGYDRGHMCPSGDRTRSVPDNSATFLMTNFVPQLGANNQGPWNDFEIYCRTLAQAGNELYIVTGGAGSFGTIANGRVNIPTATWKVVVVLPNGDNDAARVNKLTRTIAIVVPNQGTINPNWRVYRKSIRQVEALTGYDFFSAVPRMTQSLIERRVDNQ